MAAGFDTEQWTLRRVAAVVERAFGVRYHHRSLGRALRARGFSPQQPVAQATRAGRRAGRGVAEAGLAAGEKGARRSGRAVAFVDETGHSFRARLGRTWARRGHPPVLRRVSQRREVSSIVALVAPLGGPARLYARHVRGTVHAEQVVAALRYFRRRIGQPLVVAWDRSNASRRARQAATFASICAACSSRCAA